MRRHARFIAFLTAWSVTSTVFAQSNPGRIVISRGGTYQGQWHSDDPNQPAVRIATTEPVVIENSVLTSRGPLICADAGSADVVVRNVSGTALNPNVAGKAAGRFFTGDEVKRLVIEHCQLVGTGGIYVHRTPPGLRDTEITVRYNDVRNIDGRRSDGRDGYYSFNRRTRLSDGRTEEGFDLVQFVQLDQVRALARGEIAWNRVVNEPGRSRVEDIISIYESSGLPERPIQIHDNCLIGAYSVAPWQIDQKRDGWSEDWEYSGGGIMLGDGPGQSIDRASSYAVANRNVVISTGNYGIAVAAGHHLSITNNRVFGSGRLSDGRAVRSQNVGIYIWDMHHGKQRQPSTFFENAGSENTVSWFNSENQKRNDWWIPDASAWTHNVHAAGITTIADEAQEIRSWTARATATGDLPGVLPIPGPSSRPSE